MTFDQADSFLCIKDSGSPTCNYTLLTLKYEVKTPIHKSHLHARLHSITTRTDPFVSEWEIICESRMRVRVTLWENALTRCQSQSKSRANFDAIRLIRARWASLLHTSRPTGYRLPFNRTGRQRPLKNSKTLKFWPLFTFDSSPVLNFESRCCDWSGYT